MTQLPDLDGSASISSGRPERAVSAVVVLLATFVGVFVVALVVGFAVIGRHGGGAIQGWDDTVERWFPTHRGSLIAIAKFIATYLDAGPLAIVCILLTIVLLLTLRSPRGLVPIAAYLCGEGEVFLVREVILRRRPPTANYPALFAIKGVHETSYSFPSGHATAVSAVLFALAGSVAFAHRVWWPWIVALIASLFVIDTRLVLGVHWFSDVTFGLVFGAAVGIGVAYALREVAWADVVALVRTGSRRSVSPPD